MRLENSNCGTGFQPVAGNATRPDPDSDLLYPVSAGTRVKNPCHGGRNRRVTFLIVLLLVGSCLPLLAQARTHAHKSAPQPQWPHGPSTDPSYFPIAVWYQRTDLASSYKAAGFNVYMGLWKGPTEQQLAQLQAAGVQVICAQNSVGLAHTSDETIVGWLQQPDEPDNA